MDLTYREGWALIHGLLIDWTVPARLRRRLDALAGFCADYLTAEGIQIVSSSSKAASVRSTSD